MSTTPKYASTPQTPYCQVGSAETSRTAPSSLGTVMTGGASGSRVASVTVEGTGTTTAGVVRLWISNDGGTTKRLLKEIMVTAITPSVSVEVFTSTYVFPGGALLLADANSILYASTHNAETFNVFANMAADL